ncbi:hypothetical protein [Streptomyces sp. SM11]|uniref:hypothetical protein n=1 Tax=Streptomyces sp. SM11 TaxID=565557 RepID=UPI0011B0E8C4|nr:hypothetical protein [Streptomyces sp. SM11]
MARHAPNARLAALLAEAGWSAGELARAVNAQGMAHGVALRYDRTAVAHWLAGSRPRAPVPALAAAALSRHTGRLITAHDTGLAQTPQAYIPSLHTWPGEADPVKHLVVLTRGDTDPTHRTLLAQSVYTLAAVTVPTWPYDHRMLPVTDGSRASTADVQMLRDMPQVFADLSERHGGAHARSALAMYLADDVSRLLTAPGPLHRELLTVSAQLAHLLAAMTDEAGHPGLAQRYYHTALSLARDAGNRSAYAVTLRAMSTQASRLGHPRYALHLANAAVDTAGSTATPATLAFLLIQRALARAHDQQRHAALADLTAAEMHHERASSPPGPFTAYPRAGLDYQRAQTLFSLGYDTDALAALHASARHRPVGQRRTFALTHATLADALLRTGHLEEACTHWHHFLDHYPHLRSAQIDRALTRLHAGLTPHRRQRHAAAVRERAHTLTDLPTPR